MQEDVDEIEVEVESGSVCFCGFCGSVLFSGGWTEDIYLSYRRRRASWITPDETTFARGVETVSRMMSRLGQNISSHV